ncbi:MAG TPA: VCBS repeat-containing protein [Chthoniobacteraceae bacterium]|nr:VCBS repeat-containing protein [Chthoniobacteraceae bacterium]
MHSTRASWMLTLLAMALSPDVLAERMPVFGVETSQLQYGGMGAGIGYAGIETARIDGATEIFVTSWQAGSSSEASDSWRVFRWDEEKHAMRMVYASPRYPGHVDFLRLADMNKDGRGEVIVGEENYIHIYDQHTKELIASLDVGPYSFEDAKIADIDQDGDLELLVQSLSALLVIEGLSGFPNAPVSVQEIPDVGGLRIHVGQLDQDQPLEVLFGWHGVLETGSWRFEWDMAGVPTDSFVYGMMDRDGDGVQEMWLDSYAPGIFKYSFYDLTTRALHSEIDLGPSLGRYGLAQIDSDPAPEFVFAGSSRILAVDSATGDQSEIPGDFGEAQRVTGADVDSDGIDELLIARRLYIPTEGDVNRLELVKVDRPTERAVTTPGLSFFNSPVLGDINGDGKQEVLVADAGKMVILNPTTFEEIVRFLPDFRPLYAAIEPSDYRLRDVDGDNRAELIVAGKRHATAVIYIFKYVENESGGSFTEIWNAQIPMTESSSYTVYVAEADVLDVDGDGTMEVVAGFANLESKKGNDIGSQIQVFNYEDKTIQWKSGWIRGTIEDLYVRDFHQDEKCEVAAVFGGRALGVWNAANGKRRLMLRGDYTSLAAGGQGLVAGHKSGHISQFRVNGTSTGFGFVRKAHASKAPITGVTLDAGSQAVWVATERQLLWYPWRKDRRIAIGVGNEDDRVSRKVVVLNEDGQKWVLAGCRNVFRGFSIGESEE